MPGRPDIDVVDNPARRRYEAEVEGELAVANYDRSGDTVRFTHTEVPERFRGRGIGDALARGALERVRDSGSKVVADCAFMAAYIGRHPEFQDLLAGA